MILDFPFGTFCQSILNLSDCIDWKTLFYICNPFFFFSHILALSEARNTNQKMLQDFFREEYILNNAIGMCALLRALKME